MIAKGIPMPRIKRAQMNIATSSLVGHREADTILSACLKSGADEHNDTSDKDRHTATEPVVSPRNQRHCDQGPERVGRIQESSDRRTGFVKV